MANREIKFRVWDKLDQTMRTVAEINFSEQWVAVIVDTADGLGLEQRRFEDIELLQLTGLLDKNGKEIYEGDVVRDCSHADLVFEVKWDEEKAGYYMPPAFDDEYAWSMGEPDLEIIGNIYENESLITNNPTVSE